MVTLFENNDFTIMSTGHDYDFVGTIEVKSKETLAFFFEEETDDDGEVYEDLTKLSDVCYGMNTESADSHAQDICATSFVLNSNDGWKGFLSDRQQRGWFLALLKNYCPEKVSELSWA